MQEPELIDEAAAELPASVVALEFEYNKQAGWFRDWWAEFGWDQFSQWAAANKEDHKPELKGPAA